MDVKNKRYVLNNDKTPASHKLLITEIDDALHRQSS